MTVHCQQLRDDIFILRVYEKGLSYEERDPYKALCVAVRFSKDSVIITGLCGSVTRRDLAEVFLMARNCGYRYVYYERGKDRGPVWGGEIQLEGYWKGYYRVDLYGNKRKNDH